MFNKGRPKNHNKVAYFTYEARDGFIRSYEMTTKGELKELGHDFHKKLNSNPFEGIETDNSQDEIRVIHPNELYLNNCFENMPKTQEFAEESNQQNNCLNFLQQNYTEDQNLNYAPDFDFGNDFFDEIMANQEEKQEEKQDKDCTFNAENDSVEDFQDFQEFQEFHDEIFGGNFFDNYLN